MSTRSSIVWGEEVHLYHDMAEPGEDVFLELRCDNLDYSASKHSLTVRIPLYIWEVIRKHGGAKFDLAEKTDDELMQTVAKEVDERIAEYANANNEQSKSFVAFCGSGIYGVADGPREEQIKHGIAHFQEERAYQQRIIEKMKALKTPETYQKEQDDKQNQE